MMKPLGIALLFFMTSFFPNISYSAQSAIINDNTTVKKSVKSWSEFRDENVVKQKYDYSCGTASIATVLNYYFGENVSEREVLEFLLKRLDRELRSKEELEESDFAFSFQDLKVYASSRNYKALGLAMPIETLKKLKVPAILYVETRGYEHFTVFKGMDNRFVYLADPSFGNLKMRLSRFKKAFYTRKDLRFPGKGLVLIPGNLSRREQANNEFMKTDLNPGFIKEIIRNKSVHDSTQ